MIDPLHMTIAVVPLGIYLLLVGVMRMRARPRVVSGLRDTAWVAFAICGFVAAGPMELFMPEAAAARFHGYVWILLLVLYVMIVTLLALLMRPRIVIYNVAPDTLRTALADVVGKLDRDARWAGQGVILPTLGMQMSIEADGALQTVQLVAAGSQQSYAGWRHLEQTLRDALQTTPGVRGGQPLLLIVSGLGLLCMACATVAFNRAQTLDAWQAFLRQ